MTFQKSDNKSSEKLSVITRKMNNCNFFIDKCDSFKIGNDVCDEVYNNLTCDFDGGDCDDPQCGTDSAGNYWCY
jgi:hypothetical protein